MFRKLIILAAMLFLLAAAASLIAQEKRDVPAGRTGPQQRQLRARSQMPARFCPQCQCPRCQKIRQRLQQQVRQRRRGAAEGMNRPFMAPGGPKRFGGLQQPRGVQLLVRPRLGLQVRPQVGPRVGPQVGPQVRSQVGPQMPVINEWFEQLKEAYRENDREKIGQLLRKMEQLRNRIRQSQPPQTPEGDLPLPKGQPGIDRPLPERQFEGAPLPQQQRFRQRGPQGDLEVPVIRPDAGSREKENMPVSPERQRRLRQGSAEDRPPR